MRNPPPGVTQIVDLLRLLLFPLKAIYGLGFAALTLPLGPEGDRSVRRAPWVSCAIVLLCVAGFQYQRIAEPDPTWVKAHAESFASLSDILRENPCLDAPRDITDLRGAPAVRKLLDERSQACAQQGPARFGWQLQRELEALVAEHRALERAHPVWRLYRRPVDGADFTAVTAMFLHGGWFHLIGNLLFFYMVGPFIEDAFGRTAFAALYLLSGLAGGLAGQWNDPGCTLFALGASGAISGVMGAFLVRFTRRRMRFLSVVSLWMPFLRYRFSLPAWFFLVFWFVGQVVGAWSGSTGIGWWAHIGGFLFGIAFALVFKWQRIEETWIVPGVERQIAYHAHPALERAVEMRVQGRYAAARRGVEVALEAEPENPDAWRERYEIALAEGQAEEAARHATRLIGLYVKTGEVRLAARLTEEVLFCDRLDLPPRFYLVGGAQMESVGELALARLLYECLRTRRPDDPAVPISLAREARLLERPGRAEEALGTHGEAGAHPACTTARLARGTV